MDKNEARYLKRKKKAKKLVRGIGFWIVLLLVLIFFMAPLIWLVSTSFKNYIDAFAMPPKLIFTPTLENYIKVFNKANFFNNMRNSIISAVVPTVIAILVGVPCSYAIAMLLDKKEAKNLSFFFLSARIAPPIMTLLPLYIIYSKIGLLGSRWSIIVMYTLMCIPIVVWLMPVYFRELPGELREAALVDGCSEFRVFWNIILPLVRSSIAATAIYCITITWNEFLIALILSNKSSQTLPVTITSFMTFQGTEWGPMTAAGSIIMIPMLIFGFVIQKSFAKGLSSGAVKG
jgi:ABC-type glycerol-3-phosphate transport system permease component